MPILQHIPQRLRPRHGGRPIQHLTRARRIAACQPDIRRADPCGVHPDFHIDAGNRGELRQHSDRVRRDWGTIPAQAGAGGVANLHPVMPGTLAVVAAGRGAGWPVGSALVGAPRFCAEGAQRGEVLGSLGLDGVRRGSGVLVEGAEGLVFLQVVGDAPRGPALGR
jgi:hypothetical protein